MRDKPKVRAVRLSEVKTDPTVNRPLDERWVGRLASDWNEAALGVPVLSDRGNYFVPLDGQHRIEAFRAVTPEDARFMAMVHSGLAIPEEAFLFLQLNKNRNVHPFDKFEKLVTAEDADACAIKAILDRQRLHLSRSTSHEGAISAVVSLERVFRWDTSGGLLATALATAAQTWGRDPTSFQGDVLLGLSHFLRQFPEVSLSRLQSSLAKSAGGVSGLLGRGRTIRETYGGTVAAGVAEAIRALYNKGLRRKLER